MVVNASTSGCGDRLLPVLGNWCYDRIGLRVLSANLSLSHAIRRLWAPPYPILGFSLPARSAHVSVSQRPT